VLLEKLVAAVAVALSGGVLAGGLVAFRGGGGDGGREKQREEREAEG